MLKKMYSGPLYQLHVNTMTDRCGHSYRLAYKLAQPGAELSCYILAPGVR